MTRSFCMLLIFAFAILAISLPRSEAFEKKRLYAPTKVFTLGYKGKFFTIPYAYIRESSSVVLEKHGVIDVHKYNGTVNLQYLLPSLAPPPDGCDFQQAYCTGKTPEGFKTPPIGEKQYAVVLEIVQYFDRSGVIENHKINFTADGIALSKKNDGHKIHKDMGLEESTWQKRGLSFFKPLKKQPHYLMISCFRDMCQIRSAVQEEGWVYRFWLHRAHLKDWKSIFRSRLTILSKFPVL